MFIIHRWVLQAFWCFRKVTDWLIDRVVRWGYSLHELSCKKRNWMNFLLTFVFVPLHVSITEVTELRVLLATTTVVEVSRLWSREHNLAETLTRMIKQPNLLLEVIFIHNLESHRVIKYYLHKAGLIYFWKLSFVKIYFLSRNVYVSLFTLFI